MKSNKLGITQLPLLIGLGFLALVLPLVSLLASKNQDNRNLASGPITAVPTVFPSGCHFSGSTMVCNTPVPTKAICRTAGGNEILCPTKVPTAIPFKKMLPVPTKVRYTGPNAYKLFCAIVGCDTPLVTPPMY